MSQPVPPADGPDLAIRLRLALLVLGIGAVAALCRYGWGSGWANAFATGFDLSAGLFILSFVRLLKVHSVATIRRHASEYDVGNRLIPLVVGLLVLALLLAIVGELPAARCGEIGAAIKLVLALVLAWAMLNLVFMLHYAHLHYGGGRQGAFDFKGPDQPDYLDFLYFAATAGMSFAASDVDVTSRAARRSVVLHCFLAFVFNIGALAFTINVLAGGSCG